MRELLGRLLKMSVGYGAIQGLGPLLSLIFTPILTRILAPADYGIADYLATFSGAVGTLALLALPQALQAHFNDQPQDSHWSQRLIGTALTLTCLTGGLGGGVVILLAYPLSEVILKDTQYAPLFRWIGLTMFFTISNSLLVSAAQASLRVRWGMIFSLTTIVATAFSNVLFIIIWRLGVLGLVLVQFTNAIALSVVALYTMRSVLGQFTRAAAQQLIRSGAVLLPAMVAAWILQMADRLFLVNYVSATELGYYAIANRIAGLLFVVMSPVYSAWTPLALSIQNQPNAREAYSNIARYIMAAILLIALGLGLFAREILLVLAHAPYLPAAPYVGFLTYVHVINTAGAIISMGAMAGKQFKGITGAVFVGAAVNLLLNLLLIPSLKLWGATLATVIGYALSPLLLYPAAQKRFTIPYPTRRLLFAIFAQVGLMTIGILLPPIGLGLEIAFKAGLLVVFGWVLVLTGILRRSELIQASRVVGQPWFKLIRQLVADHSGHNGYNSDGKP